VKLNSRENVAGSKEVTLMLLEMEFLCLENRTGELSWEDNTNLFYTGFISIDIFIFFLPIHGYVFTLRLCKQQKFVISEIGKKK